MAVLCPPIFLYRRNSAGASGHRTSRCRGVDSECGYAIVTLCLAGSSVWYPLGVWALGPAVNKDEARLSEKTRFVLGCFAELGFSKIMSKRYVRTTVGHDKSG